MSEPGADWRGAIEQALARRDIAAAADLAEEAVASGAREPLLLNLAAWRREEQGDFSAAHRLLTDALALSPGDPLILGAIGAVLRKQGKLGEALATLDRAIATDPRVASFWLERAMALEAGGSLSGALESYRRAAELDPGSASALGGVAAIAARQGDRETARTFGERALARDPADVTALAALARVDLDSREPDRALERLAPLLADPPQDEANRALIFSLAGDAFDRSGKVDQAFDAYARSNQASAQRFDRLRQASGAAPDHRAMAERVAREFAAIDPASWRASDEVVRSPVFLIGYPRSGTTLVENILASDPSVQAIEERPTLACGDPFLKEEGGLARLAALGSEAIADLRGAYWRAAAAAGAAEARLLVDMDPLKGLKLPLIARLFPNARIVVMRRDPRDVVWSCFRANFAPSPAALEHTDLGRAAAHYDSTMRAQELFLEALPRSVHELRYEALVSDFDTVTKQLCAFLGMSWSPRLRDFARTAERRGVSTVSVTQVRKGLYDGSDQWRRYERHLQPILPVLRPWVERFGYSD